MSDERGVSVKGLVHWAIPVDDLEESQRFYTEVLGMEYRGPVGPEMRCVQFGDTKVLLCRRYQTAEASSRQSPQHLAFLVGTEDFDRAAENMRSWGVAVQRPSGPPDTIRGDVEFRREGVFVGRSLYFDDPSGNRLEIHDPHFPD